MTELVRPIVTILLFIVVLGGIVLVHELGHFLAARLGNVRVLEFGIGFPPRAKVLRTFPADPELVARWQRQRARDQAAARSGADEGLADDAASAPVGLQLTLNWLPIGGFVKMDGEDGDAADGRSFSAKPLWLRLAILLAGVVMNVVLAAVIFIGIAWLATPAFGVRVPAGGVQPGSPAAAAGIVPGDVIETLDGQVYDLYSEGILAAIHDHEGQTVSLGVRQPDGTITSVSVALRSGTDADQHGALGISAAKGSQGFEFVTLDRNGTRPLGDAIAIGGRELTRWGGLVVSGLGNLVGGLVTNPSAPPPASGPIGIAVQIGDVFYTTGWITTLYMAAVLSINLAVVNILPFPPLDGGRMLVLVIKRLFGRRVSLRAEQLTYLVGFVFLIGFILWISGFDIARQLGGGQ